MSDAILRELVAAWDAPSDPMHPRLDLAVEAARAYLAEQTKPSVGEQPSTPPPPVMCNWCGANLEHEEHYPNCKGVAPPLPHDDKMLRVIRKCANAGCLSAQMYLDEEKPGEGVAPPPAHADLIARLRRYIGHTTDWEFAWETMRRAADALSVAPRDEQDAKRYRWLRDPQNADEARLPLTLWGDNMDAAIDAAMATDSPQRSAI